MENGIKEYFKKVGNNPINPLEIKTGNESMQFVGLTKREYFAGLAMQGMLADPNLSDYNPKFIAGLAVDFSDAILKELDKPKNEAQ